MTKAAVLTHTCKEREVEHFYGKQFPVYSTKGHGFAAISHLKIRRSLSEDVQL